MSYGIRPGDLPERASDDGPDRVLAMWHERDHEGRGEIMALTDDRDLIPLEGPEHDLVTLTRNDLRARLDDNWEQAFRCGREVARDERREAREARDERRARRDWILQLALLATIAVVTLCATYVPTH